MKSRPLAAPVAQPSEPVKAVSEHPLVSHVRRRRTLLSWLGATLAVVLIVRLSLSGASEPTLEGSLAAVLEREGVRVRTESVVWLEGNTIPTYRGALFLGARDGELSDVYFAAVRPGRGGAAIDVALATNLTRSAGADESSLLQVGQHAAFLSRAGDTVEALTVLDLRGEPEELTRAWGRVQRFQNAITNLQETGRSAGFGRVRYQLLSDVREGELAVDDEGRFAFAWSEGRVVLDPERLEPTAGDTLVEAQPLEKGMPGGVTWVVDSVRNLSFVGPAPIEWLENRVFAVQDAWDRFRYATFGGEATEDVVAEELGVATPTEELDEEQRALLTAAAAELGWPPPPMTPVLIDDPVSGEGEWIPIVDDAFVNAYPGAPPAFVQSFIRPDVERPYVRVYATMWDPRQVQMRIVPGTREPESATGERGTGYIPRDERTLRTLVGAFNGGFQALHGEFGMMSDARVYIPPKPWAATVAVFDDGHVAMGSWPAPNWRGAYYDERLASRQIPAGMIDMRQNLTSMVEDGVYNPWERWWWGAAPQEEDEQTFTYRSGLCLTEEGYFSFFWGSSLGPEALGAAMVAARCARAMHLDMNSGHCGFEFFRPYRSDDTSATAPPTPDRVRSGSEFDERFDGAPRGWRLRARKAVRSMAMRFPRYTARDPRDFFYLTLRATLPGPALSDGTRLDPGGLPHAGWPYAFARADVGGIWIVRIDPRRAVATPVRRERHQRVLGGLGMAMAPTGTSVYASRDAVGYAFAIGTPAADDPILARGPTLAEAPEAEAALGVDRDGFLVYVERGSGEGSLVEVLASAGIDPSSAIALPTEARLVFATAEGGAAPDGVTPRELGDPSAGALLLYAEEQPAAEVLFPETEPAPYREWGYLQGQRVRYFPSGPPRFQREVPGE